MNIIFDPIVSWLVPVISFMCDKVNAMCAQPISQKSYSIYSEPHRDNDGKIIIENSQLYYDDVRKHGAYKAQQWVEQGKYNLSTEELEKERQRIREELDYLLKL